MDSCHGGQPTLFIQVLTWNKAKLEVWIRHGQLPWRAATLFRTSLDFEKV
jgi:hypothetical protein